MITGAQWSPWSAWSKCSISCGPEPGLVQRKRTCHNPSLTAEPAKCEGPSTQTAQCKAHRQCPEGRDGSFVSTDSYYTHALPHPAPVVQNDHSSFVDYPDFYLHASPVNPRPPPPHRPPGKSHSSFSSHPPAVSSPHYPASVHRIPPHLQPIPPHPQRGPSSQYYPSFGAHQQPFSGLDTFYHKPTIHLSYHDPQSSDSYNPGYPPDSRNPVNDYDAILFHNPQVLQSAVKPNQRFYSPPSSEVSEADVDSDYPSHPVPFLERHSTIPHLPPNSLGEKLKSYYSQHGSNHDPATDYHKLNLCLCPTPLPTTISSLDKKPHNYPVPPC